VRALVAIGPQNVRSFIIRVRASWAVSWSNPTVYGPVLDLMWALVLIDLLEGGKEAMRGLGWPVAARVGSALAADSPCLILRGSLR